MLTRLTSDVDEVAVKVVKADNASAADKEAFRKEVGLLSNLSHANIVQFYGACLELGNMFMVTELMQCGDLHSMLSVRDSVFKWRCPCGDNLDIGRGRKVALDVALGLNYLHAQNPPIMHRDLKSPNVLLSGNYVAKIADVGMARSQVQDSATAQSAMTKHWAAPEVVSYERASIKADIWSYGIIIWELVTGERVTNYRPLCISKKVGLDPHSDKNVMTLPQDCPAVARKLFEGCTQLDPKDRPTAQQLVEWLRADMVADKGYR